MTKLEIETNFETLSLIYNCGLSSKNSCGFGMIDIAHEKVIYLYKSGQLLCKDYSLILKDKKIMSLTFLLNK